METKNYDLNQTCRTCLCNKEALDELMDMKVAIFIRDEYLTPYQLLDELHFLDNAVEDSTDGFPHNICLKCFNFLVQVIDFHAVCKASADSIKKFLRENISNRPRDVEIENIKIESGLVEDIEEIVIKSELDEIMEYEKQQNLNSELDTSDDGIAASSQQSDDDSDYVNSESESEKSIEEIDIMRIIDEKEKNCVIINGKSFFIKCVECEERFGKHTAFKLHFDTVCKGSIPVYVCCYCREDFKSVESIEKHMLKQHPINRPHYCAICKSNFITLKKLRKHLFETHPNETIYTCEDCGFGCYFKISFDYHRKMPHLGPPKSCICSVCEKVFKDKYSLKKHSNTHKLFPCECCGKEFIHNTGLQAHIRCTHSSNQDGRRVYDCKLCKRKFRSLASLVKHEHTHKVVREHACDQCNCSFQNAYRLQAHIECVHLKIRPFTCTECDKTYYRSSAMEKHKRFHAVENTFKCSYCNKGFSSEHTLTIHSRNHVSNVTH